MVLFSTLAARRGYTNHSIIGPAKGTLSPSTELGRSTKAEYASFYFVDVRDHGDLWQPGIFRGAVPPDISIIASCASQ